MVWQKSNVTDFFKPGILLFLQIKIVPLGSYTAKEALFPLLIAVLEGFYWYTLQLVGYALLDIIQGIKMAPFQVVFEPGEYKKITGTGIRRKGG